MSTFNTELFQAFEYQNSDEINIFKKNLISNEKINKRTEISKSTFQGTALR
jgi:hypothetical protein